jgi:translocation and assembly module TamB
MVSRLVPDVSDVTGTVDLDLGLSGTVSKPAFSGHARLTKGGLQVPFIGLVVSDLAFAAEAGRQRINFTGGLTAGEGRLEVKGNALTTGSGAAIKLQANGENLTLASSKEYFAIASADIALEAGPEGASIDGEVLVPEARIRTRTIPEGTVSPSADVVMGTDVEQKTAYPLDLRIRLKLGKNVRVDTFGLNAKLKGDLLVFQEPGQEMLGDGQLKIVDGTYRLSTGNKLTAAVGKPLTVEQGIIVFAKTPVSNPALVMTAKREGGDVTAGVRVFGTLKDPKLTFFSDSDPGMTQSEATSYLLTGIPPKKDKQGGEDRGLSVGTYVAPKLFMEYESGLGDEEDKVKLRYEYNSWIDFQTETGSGQGADVFLKFEH